MARRVSEIVRMQFRRPWMQALQYLHEVPYSEADHRDPAEAPPAVPSEAPAVRAAM
jgi:hypothetical protein